VLEINLYNFNIQVSAHYAFRLTNLTFVPKNFVIPQTRDDKVIELNKQAVLL